MIRAPTAVSQCISNLPLNWKSQFSPGSAKRKCTVGIEYKRGLFQCDSLSSLLFCLCLVPLSVKLGRTVGYDCVELGSPVTHQLFMDDLKVYGCSKWGLSNTLNVVERVFKAIGTELGLRKCALAHIV